MKAKIDRAELHALHHFGFAAQGRVGIGIDSISAVRSLRDFLREYCRASAKL